ncbi:MAG: hypothetical protein E6J75_05270 [Deltaproteobacteria bacterium]|nr:MAG: hypothetical protein E6J79_14710 [Deltaproteobacteria bacterium]TMA58496.1 MAG: hypothetical protein E6J75_05270 [Deltaproteobacteria bacterium]
MHSSVQRIDLCGVAVDVATDHLPLARYLEGHFAQLQSGGAAAGEPDVSVRVRWTEGPRESVGPETVFPDWPVETMIDRHVHVGANRVVWLYVDDVGPLAVASEVAGDTRRFELRFHFTLGSRGWRERLKRVVYWRNLPALRRGRLSTLTYYAVYYPVWWQLESRGAGHPLHAAGVAIDGRALVLAGLPGAGKSTLATSLLAVPGAELLADNVVLHDGRQIYGCFEPLLLDEQSRSWLGQRQTLRALGRRHVFARDAYHAPHRTGGLPPGAVVVLARGRETRLTPIDSGMCARTLLAINEVAKEVRRYHVLAAVLGMIEPAAQAHAHERAARLERLLAGVPCYVLEVREGAPAEAVAVLRDLATPARQVAR